MYSQQEKTVLAQAADILKKKLLVKEAQSVIEQPEAVRDYCRYSIVMQEREVFGVMLLDNQLRLIESKTLFLGSITHTDVYPREVVKLALNYNAAAVIFYHNHPSGACEGSDADRRLTRRLTDALALVEVRVLDHIVVALDGVSSFAERGWIG
ncbi:hypothetical protein BBN09_10790 [Vibrio parahaemolyticus]|jgi:DNA repair protein RadC|uniref:RadC family protein n=1 Tax=Vibrio parahaemolyticus TaxID=670 RepID=UPI00084B19A5|nr:DNA repair protein RadC [Vibrio parahaemolyticus]OEB90917.1 hypothetical protein BBN09_10790 [Vibrio parahaemolyticus]